MNFKFLKRKIRQVSNWSFLMLEVSLAVVPDFCLGHRQIMISVSAKMFQWRMMTSIRHSQTLQIDLTSTRGHRSNSTTIIKRSRTTLGLLMVLLLLLWLLVMMMIWLRFAWIKYPFGHLDPPEKQKIMKVL